MAAIPVWFGPRERLLFGYFHVPEGGDARGGVVMCAPLGRDYLRAHYAVRKTAERLAEEGFCCLRFDYDGLGDSMGDNNDPDRVEAWLGSVDEAVKLMSSAGAGWIAFYGMRSGSLLAATASERFGGSGALVMVDPTSSGRAFVSEQRALAAMALDVQRRDDGSVETPGIVYSEQTVGDLKKLRIGSGERRPAEKVLVLVRAGTRPDSSLAARLGPDGVEWQELTGQEDLVDAEAPNQLVPFDDIERVVRWTSAVAPAGRTPVLVPDRGGEAIVGSTPDGSPIVEKPVSLGPHGLFAVSTDVPGRTGGPTVVFLNVATEPHVGPARLWVELAREWAARGLRSVRVDMSGLGESPVRDGEPEFVIRLPVAFDDVNEIAGAVSPHDPTDVVFVGLCSSAYQALDSSLIAHPRGVVALNPVLTFQVPEVQAGHDLDPRRRVALVRNAVIEQFHAEGPLSSLRRRFPNLGWRIRTLMAMGKRPSLWLKDLLAPGTKLMLVCGDREARPFQQGVSKRTMARLVDSGGFRFEYIAGLDHGLLVSAHRDRIRKMVTDQVSSWFAPDAVSSDATAQCGGVRS